MRKSSSIWQRVSKRRPCPVCEKPDWCLYVGQPSDPEAAICARIESGRRCGDAGWLHILHCDGSTWSPRLRRIELSAARITTPALNLDKLAADFRQAVKPEALDKLAVALGVSTKTLMRLGVGWSVQNRAWTFPMHNSAGDVLGIRLRLSNGKKLSVRGGREGLFLPTGLDMTDRLFICEGPTDTAALLDLNFNAVGRPSCTGGVKLLIEFVRKAKPSGVVLVADGDAPGQRGAEMLTAALVAYSAAVRIIAPPSGVKDAREWKRLGATAAEVQAAIDAAPIRKLQVSIGRKGRT